MSQIDTLLLAAQAETLCHAELAIVSIRGVNARQCPKTGRFGADRRELKHVSHNGKLLSNLFQIGTAMVVSQDGTVVKTVVSRNATRAAAAVALRDIRAGNERVSIWDVSQRNNNGQSYNETVQFDVGATQSETSLDETGDEKANYEVPHSEMRLGMGKRIDDIYCEVNAPIRD